MTETASSKVSRFKDAIQQEWDDADNVAAWKKWRPQYTAATQTLTDSLLGLAGIEPGMQILDLASGTGEPALTLARAAGPAGRVTATDMVPGMLAVAEEIARSAGISNIEFREVDAHELPFLDESFDRVTSRNGLMYFVEYLKALREGRRVLKVGGRIALACNGPFEQPFFLSTIGVLAKHVTLPPPDPDAPNPFMFAEEGKLTTALQEAGFGDIEERHLEISFRWQATPEEAWQFTQDVGAPFRPLLEALSQEKREEVFQEIHSALAEYQDGDELVFPYSIVLASGTR